ncbi:hypothetical protein K4B79_06105 [Streptomyces lincolnensis]|uniref:hypothetical protein n=1 Tax=Streptomyces lincolnensis TaxID=1915 RepID=UPI001E2A80BA|nr:hypothetical protein [Streptomyces lincolnensis]MCD7437796.1 hypothetical protein [Streptomyces lincolnensis]
MRRTRIEKRRGPARAGRATDETSTLRDLLDPRDSDIVRAKRAARGRSGTACP